MVGMPMGDVDAGESLAVAAHRLCQFVGLVEGEERVNEDPLFDTRDQCAAHGGPDRLVAGALGGRASVRAHRRDVYVDGERGCIHVRSFSSDTCHGAHVGLELSSSTAPGPAREIRGAKATSEVVIDHADVLHEGVHARGSDEPVAL